MVECQCSSLFINVTVSWSYHPKQGLEVMYQKISEVNINPSADNFLSVGFLYQGMHILSKQSILYFSTALTLDQMVQRGEEVVGQEKRRL